MAAVAWDLVHLIGKKLLVYLANPPVVDYAPLYKWNSLLIRGFAVYIALRNPPLSNSTCMREGADYEALYTQQSRV